MATYVRELLRYLPELDPLDSTFPKNNFLWNNVYLPFCQLRKRWPLYHSPSYTGPLVNVRPLVLSVHDISYLVRPEWYPYTSGPLRRAYYEASIRVAERVIVPSDFSADEVTRLFPHSGSKIRRIHLGVSSEFFPDPERAALVREALELPSEYLLHVGDLHNRRNIPRIIQVGKKLQMPVVLVGRIFDRELRLPEGIRLLSGLSQEDLRGVYSGAAVFLYASLYEGFGLPLLEAMACGIPVVAARRTAIPEVCGEAAILVEPQVEGLAEGVRMALEQRSSWVERGLKRAEQFSWKATAEGTRRIYQELLG